MSVLVYILLISIIIYIVSLITLFNVASALDFEYKLGNAKRTYCDPAFMIHETGDYGASKILASKLRIIANVQLSSSISTAILGIITASVLIWQTSFIFQSFKMSKAIFIVPFTMIMLPFFTKFQFRNILGAIGTVATCVVVLWGKKYDNVTLSVVLASLVAMSILTSTSEYNYDLLKTQLNVYETQEQIIRRAFKNLWLNASSQEKADLKEYLLYNAKRLNARDYATTRLEDDGWKYIMNENGRELSQVFPLSDGICPKNTLSTHAYAYTHPDDLNFTPTMTLYACNFKGEEFKYEPQLTTNGRVGTLTVGNNAIDTSAQYCKLVVNNTILIFELESPGAGHIVYIHPPDYSLVQSSVKNKYIDIGEFKEQGKFNVPYIKEASLQRTPSGLTIHWVPSFVVSAKDFYIIAQVSYNNNEDFMISSLDKETVDITLNTTTKDMKVNLYLYHISQSIDLDIAVNSSNIDLRKIKAKLIAEQIGLAAGSGKGSTEYTYYLIDSKTF